MPKSPVDTCAPGEGPPVVGYTEGVAEASGDAGDVGAVAQVAQWDREGCGGGGKRV